MALESGKPPLRLLDEGNPDSWSPLDLDILAKWKSLKNAQCPGCGRPLSQHLFNQWLGREETPDDYVPYSMDCPAQQAIADGQKMWQDYNKSAIESYHKGTGVDPSAGLYWLAQGAREALPSADNN